MAKKNTPYSDTPRPEIVIAAAPLMALTYPELAAKRQAAVKAGDWLTMQAATYVISVKFPTPGSY